ncbi:RNA polymerase sigma factor [Streptomyces winkii]|uniref:RNA polymerase sigma factor n=1 Tax=Streptomyces winkii TaxID=3051178 RepID=UPI0028D03113|nr:sigma-70 family RNA polymerase sigma factor [Streptomyces sp. DSM 40971]
MPDKREVSLRAGAVLTESATEPRTDADHGHGGHSHRGGRGRRPRRPKWAESAKRAGSPEHGERREHDEPGEDTAVDELFRRHHSAVFSYALACCRDTKSAEALTAEAFTRSVRAVRSDGSPATAWRPHLLVSVRRTAADWAGTDRRGELSPDFVQWYDHATGELEGGGGEPMLRLEADSAILQAFRSLPERWQTVLWHTAVEGEPAGKVAALLGVVPGSVATLASRAGDGLREAYVAAHREQGSRAGECGGYGSLLEAAARGAGRRANSDDLDHHLRDCTRCRGALAELNGLDQRLGTMLPAGVLLWGGSAYVATRLAEAGTSKDDDADGAAPAKKSPVWWRRVKGLSIPAAALAGSVVAAVGLIVYLTPLTSFTDDDRQGSPPLQVVSKPPETVIKDGPTVTSTPTSKPSASDGPSGGTAGLPDSQGGFVPLHLRSDGTLGEPQARSGAVTLARTTGNHDGKPHEPETFVLSGVTGEYRGGATRFDLLVDAGTSIGNGQQLRVSYDLTGNGSWDRVETYGYYESDNAPGYEHYTEARGLTPGATGASGSLGDLADGRIKVEVWDAIGAGGSTVATGDTSLVRIPFG